MADNQSSRTGYCGQCQRNVCRHGSSCRHLRYPQGCRYCHHDAEGVKTQCARCEHPHNHTVNPKHTICHDFVACNKRVKEHEEEKQKAHYARLLGTLVEKEARKCRYCPAIIAKSDEGVCFGPANQLVFVCTTCAQQTPRCVLCKEKSSLSDTKMRWQKFYIQVDGVRVEDKRLVHINCFNLYKEGCPHPNCKKQTHLALEEVTHSYTFQRSVEYVEEDMVVPRETQDIVRNTFQRAFVCKQHRGIPIETVGCDENVQRSY